METSRQLHAPAILLPGKKHSDSHRSGSWEGPRPGVDNLEFRQIYFSDPKSNHHSLDAQP